MTVKYVHEFIHGKKEKERAAIATYEEREISPVVMEILRNDEAFRKSRVFGDPRLGVPLEYEKLVVVDEDGERTFEYFNKGIHYMTQSGEPARRIFQAFAFFMGKLLDKKKELAAQPRVPAEPDDEQENFWDFSEDEISVGPEWEAKGKLLMELLRFGQALIKDKLEAPNGVFHPQFADIFASAPAGTQHLLYSAFTEWLILDHAIDEKRNTVADLYHMRKKLLMKGLQKRILPILRETAMDLYEVRTLHPGKGMVLQRVDGGEMVNVIEIMGSRQLKRSSFVACRLWLLDGAYRFSGSVHDFKSKHRSELEIIIAQLLAHGARHGRHWRERFPLEMFRLWVEKNVESV